MKPYFLIVLSLFILANISAAQRPPMLRTYKEYRQSVLQNPAKQMVELKRSIAAITYDLRYAGKNNFMKRRMYSAGTVTAYLRRDAAAALRKVNDELYKSGLGLKIFDAYRPWSVSNKFWQLVPDERYVANPARGSNHNRGIAVDLTIIDLKTGSELNMGTGFDNFTDTAHHSFTGLPQQTLQNRILLKSLMEKHGYTAYNEEWWHYTFKTEVKFEVMDVPVQKMKRL